MHGHLVVDTKPDFARDWAFVFLQDVTDKTDRPCHHAKAADNPPGKPELAADRADRSGCIDWQ